MSGTAGYSLDQLLEWCKQDRLIDGFRKNPEGILIWQEGVERKLSHTDAKLLLTSIFTGVDRRSSNSSDPHSA